MSSKILYVSRISLEQLTALNNLGYTVILTKVKVQGGK